MQKFSVNSLGVIEQTWKKLRCSPWKKAARSVNVIVSNALSAS